MHYTSRYKMTQTCMTDFESTIKYWHFLSLLADWPVFNLLKDVHMTTTVSRHSVVHYMSSSALHPFLGQNSSATHLHTTPQDRACSSCPWLLITKVNTRAGILILATPCQIGYKNCWSYAPMQQEGRVLPLPTYIMGAVNHKMGIRSSQLIVSRCRDLV